MGNMHGDGNIPQIPVPRGGRYNQDTDFGGLPYDSTSLTPGIAAKDYEAMTQEERDNRLKEYLAAGEEVTRKRRDLQLERDHLELENKRRFSSLAFKFAVGFGVVVFIIVFFLVGLYGWSVIKSGIMSDTSILTSIFSTFADVLRIITGQI